MSNTNEHWKRWAEQDPYHGVLGRGFGIGDIEKPEVRELFFRQGEAHIDKVLGHARQMAQIRMDDALDFGCGVGRLVQPLLGKYRRVAGVDIAPRMLEIARENCGEPDRLTLVNSLDALEADGRQFDLVHSYIVLQHIKPGTGLQIMEQMIRLTRPGGVVALHFTVGDIQKRRRVLNAFRYRIPPLHWAYNVSTKRPWNLPMSEMNAYPVRDVLALFRTQASPDFTGWTVNQGGHQGMMLIAIKPGAVQ
jgi:SAM-dependent methyltransferase